MKAVIPEIISTAEVHNTYLELQCIFYLAYKQKGVMTFFTNHLRLRKVLTKRVSYLSKDSQKVHLLNKFSIKIKNTLTHAFTRLDRRKELAKIF